MTRQDPATKRALAQALRAIALRHPGAEEGVSCKGTALESCAFKAAKKSFFFMGPKDVKVKLRESLAEVARLARKEPDRYRAGANGWVTATFTDDVLPPLELLERWIGESYQVIAGKPLDAVAKKAPKKKTAPRARRRT